MLRKSASPPTLGDPTAQVRSGLPIHPADGRSHIGATIRGTLRAPWVGMNPLVPPGTGRIVASILASSLLSLAVHADVQVKTEANRVVMTIDGDLFTAYHFGTAPHVFYYPVIGPDGKRFTRSYPMEQPEGEEHDHPHHRSLWFSHGDVNGIDFWAERGEAKGFVKGLKGDPKIEHTGILKAEGGKDSGTIQTSQKWITQEDGKVHLTSEQTLRLHSVSSSSRSIDFTIKITAKEAVTLGDTKEGTAAIRIAESMRVKGANKTEGKGHMLNSSGDKDGDCWGKRADWVHYSGPIDGQPHAITFMEHPSTPRHPNRWHARDYGLFAANPFADGAMDKALSKDNGAVKLAAGESRTYSYRLILHKGEVAEPVIRDLYKAFSR